MYGGRGKSLRADKIIESAIKEFAEKGYEKASTERICKNAGVSKGLLFHYFGTKKQLYLESYERVMADFMGVIGKLTFEDCETYFDNIVKMSNAKLNYFMRNPDSYDMMLEVRYNVPSELRDELTGIFEKYVDMDKYYSEMVFGQYKFREGVDTRKAWEVIQAVVALVERRIITEVVFADKNGRPKLKKILDMSDELFEYFDIVFNGISGGGNAKKGKGA